MIECIQDNRLAVFVLSMVPIAGMVLLGVVVEIIVTRAHR